MRKLTVTIFFLTILDIILMFYLKDIINSKLFYEYKMDDLYFIYQKDDIRLNSIDDFIFDNYFYIQSFNTINYQYKFNEDTFELKINKDIYHFNYSIIEPIIIEKTIYKDVEIEVEKKYEECVEEYFFVNNDYLFFDLGTDFDYVRNEILNNINTTYETRIDYSQLNTSHIGQYKVKYIADDEILQIIVEIG